MNVQHTTETAVQRRDPSNFTAKYAAAADAGMPNHGISGKRSTGQRWLANAKTN